MFIEFRNICKLHLFDKIMYIYTLDNKTIKLNEVQTYFVNCIVKKTDELELLIEYIDTDMEMNNLHETEKIIFSIIDDLKEYIDISKISTNFNKKIKIYGKENNNYPNEIQISLTSRCNHHCKHCFREAEVKGIDLDIKKLQIFLNYLKGKSSILTLTGGEPFLYENIEAVVNNNHKDFELYITTSGYGIDNIAYDVLKKFKQIQLTLYGASQSEHDNFVGVKGSFKNVLNNIDRLIANNINLLVVTQAKNNDIEHLNEFVKLCISKNIKKVMIGEISALGRGKKLDIWNSYDTDIIHSNIHKLQKMYYGDIEILFDDGIREKRCLNDDFFKCGAGQIEWFILEDGNIMPCSLLDKERFSMGNIYIDSYKLIIEDTEKFSHIQKNWFNILNEKYLKYGTDFSNVCENISRCQ